MAPATTTTTTSTSTSSGSQFSLGWDLQSLGLGLLNTDNNMSLVMHSNEQILSSIENNVDLSTGYLEDALYESGERSKRRRLLLYNHDHHQTNYEGFLQSYSNPNPKPNWCDDQQMSTLSENWSEEANIIGNTKMADQEAISASLVPFDHSSTSMHQSNSFGKLHPAATNFSGGTGNDEMNKRKNNRLITATATATTTTTTTTRVVYPFALVKPGGIEGDTTLNDINERILMPPTRPVRHPVGDFACRPCVSADGQGPGLSGKAVVALTRIHTQGSGTITIIRTRG
ncbi:hypothetical protein ACFE04_020217 [Oxalis oulophora]